MLNIFKSIDAQYLMYHIGYQHNHYGMIIIIICTSYATLYVFNKINTVSTFVCNALQQWYGPKPLLKKLDQTTKMLFWVWWNAFWHSVGDSLLSSFFIVWSHCSSYSTQGPSHNALGHISDVCNDQWAANTQLTLDNVLKCAIFSPVKLF